MPNFCSTLLQLSTSLAASTIDSHFKGCMQTFVASDLAGKARLKLKTGGGGCSGSEVRESVCAQGCHSHPPPLLHSSAGTGVLCSLNSGGSWVRSPHAVQHWRLSLTKQIIRRGPKSNRAGTFHVWNVVEWCRSFSAAKEVRTHLCSCGVCVALQTLP